ncbi:MAG: competence protein ComA [Promethearchaeota archaeon Loki_b32]|nr:MAG: competence protein ComA [Candidatus Lokiarchaeota archaeon Loki_b32]
MDILKRIEKLIKDFSEQNLKISIAESCTGGFISHMFTNISGASKVFERGIVCYSNQAKIDLLNVDPITIEKFGAVSENVVKELASNIRVLSNVDIGIAISGIAGPTGGTPEKPVGLVFICISTEKETSILEYNFKTDRITFKKRVLDKIIQFLEEFFSDRNHKVRK